MPKPYVYAIYKGDEFIDLGTKKELSIRMKVKPEYIGYLSTPANKRKIEKRKIEHSKQLIAIRIGKVGDNL